METWLRFVLSIGLLTTAVDVRAVGFDKAASRIGAALPFDTSRACMAARPPRWYGPSDRGVLPGGLTAESQSAGRGPTLGRFIRTLPEIPEPMVNQGLCGADGNVLSMAQSGNTLYIAGSFRSVGANAGGCVAFDAQTGQATTWFPKVAGSVNAMVPDGTGGWFIGGEFSGVGGKPRACLAQVRADGSVSDWSPRVTGSPGYIDPPSVYAIAACNDRVYVGGAFRMIDGLPRMSFGCVDAHTGAVLDWAADLPVDEYITALVPHRDTLLVGGDFTSIGGAARGGLAAFNGVTGDLLPWQLDLYGGANALLAVGDTLYIGGTFTEIGGWRYAKLAAASIAGASPLPISFRFGGVWQQYAPLLQVTALDKVGDTLYVAGNFTQLGGQGRPSIAAVNAGTGDALAWSPDSVGPCSDGWPPPLCTSMCVAGGSLYVGGYFESVAGQPHRYLASWDRHSGRVTDWTPAPDDVPAVIASKGDTLFVGGLFHMVGGWQHRAGLAAIDLTTGRVRPWNPNPNGAICTAVAVRGDRVFVSGDFSVIGGDPQARSYFAALDTTNGEVTNWDPGANDLASVFMFAGDTLYAGGAFTEVGGQARSCLAAIDVTTGAVLPWDPSANWPGVRAMTRRGETIFLGGVFSQVGGQPRRSLAAVDAYTGALSEWNPGTDGNAVEALLIAGNTLYAGGNFRLIGGEARNAIAALDAQTGAVAPWYPAPTAWGVPSEVKALALHDSLLYVGGAFATINGQPRICLAAVDTASSLATDWDPGLDGYVWSLLASGSTLFAGGGFSRAGGLPADGLAAFSFTPPPPPPPVSLMLAQCVPNPVHSNAVIRYGLSASSSVTLSIYDIQGRRVATPLDHVLQSAGYHDVPLRMDSWRAGVYLYRLEAGGRSSTRKMVVVG
jgi:trimeric autotransporter adhesin